jgi:drug/metabolite transporter (DMT)-like permease
VDLEVALLVLASAFLHASWNAILKRQPDPERAVAAVLVIAVLNSAIIAAWSAPHVPPARVVAWSLAAGMFEAGYFVTLGRALARAPLGAVYTIARGGALLAVWPISVLWLGERVTAPALVGTALVGGGLAAVGLGDGETRRNNGGRPTFRRGVGWAIACALFITGYHLCYKRALAADGVPTVVVTVSLGTAMAVNMTRTGWTGIRRAGEAFAKHPMQVVLTGLLATASFVLFLNALSHAGAGVALALRNTSVLFAQVLAIAIGERPRAVQVGGAVLVAVGAVALAWPAR